MLNGTWRAFISVPSTAAPNRIIGNGPWYAPDAGAVVVLNRSALTLGLVSSPSTTLTFENGDSSSGSRIFWSGTTSAGMPDTLHCSNWTSSTSASNGMTGSVVPGTLMWSAGTNTCDTTRRLVCVEQDLAPLRLSPRPTTPKRMFVSSLTFTGNLGGVAGADSTCGTVAMARSLSGQWRAVLSSAGGRAADRPLSDGPYTLLDGGVVFPNRSALALALPTLSTAALTDELGVPPTGALFWSGTTVAGGLATTTCSNWTSSSSSQSGQTGITGTASTSAFSWANTTTTCDVSRRLLCVEQ